LASCSKRKNWQIDENRAQSPKIDLTFPSDFCQMVSFMTQCFGLVCRLMLAVVVLGAGGCTYDNFGDYHYPYDSRYNGRPVVDPPVLTWSSQARI
jgi:hypothetical protein